MPHWIETLSESNWPTFLIYVYVNYSIPLYYQQIQKVIVKTGSLAHFKLNVKFCLKFYEEIYYLESFCLIIILLIIHMVINFYQLAGVLIAGGISLVLLYLVYFDCICTQLS